MSYWFDIKRPAITKIKKKTQKKSSEDNVKIHLGFVAPKIGYAYGHHSVVFSLATHAARNAISVFAHQPFFIDAIKEDEDPSSISKEHEIVRTALLLLFEIEILKADNKNTLVPIEGAIELLKNIIKEERFRIFPDVILMEPRKNDKLTSKFIDYAKSGYAGVLSITTELYDYLEPYVGSLDFHFNPPSLLNTTELDFSISPCTTIPLNNGENTSGIWSQQTKST